MSLILNSSQFFRYVAYTFAMYFAKGYKRRRKLQRTRMAMLLKNCFDLKIKPAGRTRLWKAWHIKIMLNYVFKSLLYFQFQNGFLGDNREEVEFESIYALIHVFFER